MPVKIPNCITKNDRFKFKKISKFEEKHGHIEDYAKKSVKYMYDEEVMSAVKHAVESNADDVEVLSEVSVGNLKKVTNKSDRAIKRPTVDQLVKYIVGKEVDIQESIPHMTKPRVLVKRWRNFHLLKNCLRGSMKSLS